MTWRMRQNAPLANLQTAQSWEDWVCCHSGGPQEGGKLGRQKPHKVPQKEIYLQTSEILWSWGNKSISNSVKNAASSGQAATVSFRREIHCHTGDSLTPVWKLWYVTLLLISQGLDHTLASNTYRLFVLSFQVRIQIMVFIWSLFIFH